jgi:hypothetical protein
MALIDRGMASMAEMIPVLIEFARRCPECPALASEDLLRLEERTAFLAKLPPEVHRWLKIASAERGMGMNDILVAALDSTRIRLGEPAAVDGNPANLEVKEDRALR